MTSLSKGAFILVIFLKNVLNVNPSFWIENNELWAEINDLIKDKMDLIGEHEISTGAFYNAMT